MQMLSPSVPETASHLPSSQSMLSTAGVFLFVLPTKHCVPSTGLTCLRLPSPIKVPDRRIGVSSLFSHVVYSWHIQSIQPTVMEVLVPLRTQLCYVNMFWF